MMVLAGLSFGAPGSGQMLKVGNKVEHSVSFIDFATGREVASRATGRGGARTGGLARRADGGRCLLMDGTFGWRY